jgi:hypothetical protein
MDKSFVAYLKEWIHSYVKSYQSDDPERQRNFDLKEDHTWRVCREIIAIGRDLTNLLTRKAFLLKKNNR